MKLDKIRSRFPGIIRIARNRKQYTAPAILILAGCLLIISTYPTHVQTTDEPAHIACGMEWLDRGTYKYENQHPPLARAMTAVGLYAWGARSTNQPNMLSEGNEILNWQGKYYRNLTLSRAGVLLFFIAASLLVWWWSKRLFGKLAAFCSTLIFVTLPPILAHSGLATTDMAITATLFGAFVALSLWLESPTRRRSIILGIVAALAILSKFSALLFLPVIGLILIILSRAWQNPKPYLKSAIPALLVCVLIIWAGYRFNTSPLVSENGMGQQYLKRIGEPVYRLAAAPVFPLRELINGVYSVWVHNQRGHRVYFMGEVRNTGWWYYFPVLAATKTPVPFLLLVVVGGVLLFRSNPSWQIIAPLLCAVVIILVCLPSQINLGLRHILVVYPMLALVAGYGVKRLFEIRKNRATVTIIAALLLWQTTSTVFSAPDFLPWFNLFASDPSYIATDSDLDWGQDLGRLREAVDRRGIETISLACPTWAYVKRHIPGATHLQPYQEVSGWIAVSIRLLRYDGETTPPGNGYDWLKSYAPVERIGHSVYLYYVPGEPITP